MNYLQDQVVQNYAGTAARGSAIGSAVSQGMVSYLDDSNSLEVYKTTGTAVAGWEPVNLAQSPNYIINGAFEINQRGYSSGAGSFAYTVDRWVWAGVDGTVANSLQAFTPGSGPASDIEARNFLRASSSGQSAAGAQLRWYQGIEDVTLLAGKTITVSFYAKVASGTPSVAIEMTQNFGTGGSPSAAVLGITQKIVLSGGSSWTRYFVTLQMPSIAGKTLGTSPNTSASFLTMWFSAGSDANSRTQSLGIQSNTFDIWGVQVEAGQTATPFRRNANSLQGELAACQRYFERSYNIGVALGTNTNDGNISFRTTNTASASLTIAQSWYFKVSKRGTPTVRTYGAYTGTIDTINVGTSNFSATVYGASQNGASAFVGGTIPANSDISWQWTAESEL
jgi:hypothetical protein